MKFRLDQLVIWFVKGKKDQLEILHKLAPKNAAICSGGYPGFSVGMGMGAAGNSNPQGWCQDTILLYSKKKTSMKSKKVGL